MTNHPLLDQAADLIERHIKTLNTDKDECPCCGVTKYVSFDDYRAHTELTAMVNKLRGRFK